MRDFDIIVVGAGPAGLGFARALEPTGLRIALIERQAEAELASPPVDGREIALTHRSVATLKRCSSSLLASLLSTTTLSGSTTTRRTWLPDLAVKLTVSSLS